MGPHGIIDGKGNVTIVDEQGQPMTTQDIDRMCQDAQAEQDAWDAAGDQGQRDILDRMTGGMFTKMFSDI